MLSKFASMTFVAYINKFFKKNRLLLLILFLALVFRLYRIQEAFIFDYDQQIPAQAAYDFFVNKKISLIGQELSFPGLYLGPLHNWLQFIPYGLCNLRPECVPYFYLATSLITIAFLYTTLKVTFSSKVATVATLLVALSLSQVSMERGVNSNYFILLSSSIMLYCLGKHFKGENKYYPLGAFVAGISTVNFNPVFIFTSFAYFAAFFIRKNRKYKLLLLSLVVYFVNYAPLAIFNFRHNNLLIHNISTFLSANATTQNISERFYFMVFKVVIPFVTFYLFSNVNLFLSLILGGIFIVGLIHLKQHRDNVKYFIILWPIIVVFLFIFYHGHIPDYYSQQMMLPLLIIFSLGITRNKLFTVVLLILFIFQNLYLAYDRDYPINYQLKKRVVNYIVSDSNNKSFNVYYDLPPGLNTGYGTLFKLIEIEPQENQTNLYILTTSQMAQPSGKYQEIFKDKKVTEKDFNGVLSLVSVK